MKISDEEIRRRTPVWAAMSELFLDTEIEERIYANLAYAIHNAEYFSPFARAILEREVLPVFADNLRSVTGEWTGWSVDDMRNAVLAWLRQSWCRRALRNARLHRFRKAFMRREWPRVERLL